MPPIVNAWTQADRARMAEFTVALDALAREHGFRLESNLQVIEDVRSFPRLRLTFQQGDQPQAQAERALAAQAIRAHFANES
ncbi:hypothetical protein [Deinococcus multiflagellatus]|uniref:Uncharacterized protein n=1 Tax=Deinococcus multiflagellatus TaxID=1656887 RepID=A0ABW1ZHY4_9DEIO|nr:hypothetical protein [Deinococcus multiflagellatus]MBZ9712191.1 hypothetical protein [Deinococcus multiflagellatus]